MRLARLRRRMQQPQPAVRLLFERTGQLDGVAFSATERTVISADLLLADLRRADAESGVGSD